MIILLEWEWGEDRGDRLRAAGGYATKIVIRSNQLFVLFPLIFKETIQALTGGISV